MGKQFQEVSGKYGAPMGRVAYGTPEKATTKIRLFRVLLNQGYDDGGAYWGCGTSWRDQLYCAVSGDDKYRAFVRAGSREEARDALSIPHERLAVSTRGKKHVD